MAITNVNERGIGRTADQTTEVDTYTRVFLVESDSIGDGPKAARLAAGVPRIGDSHPSDSSAFCNNITPVETSDRLTWEVIFEYTTGPLIVSADPFADIPNIVWSTVKTEVVADRDIDGNPVQNSATDTFDPPLTKRKTQQKVTIGQNEISFDPDEAEALIDTVNSAAIIIAGKSAGIAGAYLEDWTAETKVVDEIEYFRTTKVVIFDSDTFDDDVLDQGFNTLDISSGKTIPIKDKEGKDVETEVKLDGAGGELGKVPPAVPFYITFSVIPRSNFDLIKLPTAPF